MAKRLESFPSLPSQSRYPWDEWLDGQPWEVRPGEDFDSRASTFVGNARLQARRRGGKIRTRNLGDGGLVIQFQRAA